MIMCTEWGDVSQVVTISLAAKYGMWTIIVGGGAALTLCMGVAVILGACVSKLCSERWSGIISGFLFIGFGLKELYEVLFASNTV